MYLYLFCILINNVYSAIGVYSKSTFLLNFIVTKKTMFASTAPRVVLIHREFAIGTTDSLINLPKHHKL